MTADGSLPTMKRRRPADNLADTLINGNDACG
jgi:hypothetical protein